MESLRPEMFPEKTCVISINEPESNDGDANLHPNWYKVFRIRFWDVTKRLESGFVLAGHPATAIDPMTEDQAKELADFIKENEDCTILVHCRAGISRSAAVARFLMERGWADISQYEGFIPPYITGRMPTERTNVSRANIHVLSLLRHQFPDMLPEGAV